MGIENITYGELKNSVVTYIQNNCYNINNDKFLLLPEQFKSEYTNKEVYSNSEGPNYTSHAYISIVSTTAISKITDTVDTDLTNFLTGYNNLNSNIPVKEFIGFFNNIVSFCSRYLRFTTSQFSNTSYLIYGDTGSSVKYTGENDDIIYAKDMNDILNVLQNRLSIVVRCYPVKYTYTFD